MEDDGDVAEIAEATVDRFVVRLDEEMGWINVENNSGS
jgi:hypothetical protein